MREIKFKKFIPVIWEIANRVKTQKKGTGCWEDGFSGKGLFHQWASDYDEYETNAGNFTVALIELKDGTVQKVTPENLKFTDPS